MLFISSATLCNIFQQNSTNPIVTSNGFQFGYIFVTVMLHSTKRKRAVIVLTQNHFGIRLYNQLVHFTFFIYVQLTTQLLFSHPHLE
ncbi:hypothetical protein CN386_05430 [Bacillus cereus]|nr:hypothetical protein MLA2C4_26825 [Bacillus mobilis]PEU83690.1 hypothetical protein CN386_05430 [Bacillus cereus]PGT75095.1 hypothetical protein COD14_11785 [Bacillus cereus]PGW00066.1 hypothetical protein COD86_01490 [Bacillus cereus]